MKQQQALRVCIFCGSAAGRDSFYAKAAEELGRLIATQGWELVYGGGNTGLMGEIAQAALRAGGRVIGIMPELLITRERALMSISQFEKVPDMATRKQRMIELSDVFITLPGGLGTLDELFEVLTWYQLGLHQKPTWLLNQDGFYDALLSQIETMQTDGFLHGSQLPLYSIPSPQELIFDIRQKLSLEPNPNV